MSKRRIDGGRGGRGTADPGVRTPLHQIKGNVELLLTDTGDLSHSARRCLDDIVIAIQDLEAAIEPNDEPLADGCGEGPSGG